MIAATRERARNALAGLFAVVFVALAAVPAFANDEAVETFSGDWYVFDLSHSSGANPCRLTLEAQGISGESTLLLRTRDCAGGLGTLSGWNIEGDKLRLYNSSGIEVAALGGTPTRLTGVELLGDTGVVLERASGGGDSAAIAAAVRVHRCYYLGLTAECAATSDLGVPEFSGDEPRLAEVQTLGTVAARSQPSRGSPEVGTIQEGTCIKVNQCLVASDGVWCRARFGETSVWLAKNALRRGQWPIITYRNGCVGG